MSQTYEYCDQQAKAALAEAEKSSLANVRERELRSAHAWREMADRAILVNAEREKATAYREARRAEAVALAQSAFE